MNQDAFERRHGADWARFEAWLKHSEPGGRRAATPPLDVAEVPHLYRRICHHLALARERHYGSRLVERLHALVLRGHQQLYGARAGGWARLVEFAGSGFPRLIRTEARLILLASVLFFLPALLMFLGVLVKPDLAFTVLDPAMAAELEQMYSPANTVLGRTRDAGTDLVMFGFYIRNNISIAFQTFAGGILFGLGTLFYLIFNGVFLGTAAGHLTGIGYIHTFYTFVIAHGAFELTAIVFAGAAGLKLGWALAAPGPLGRKEALRQAAAVSVRIIYGAAAMLLLAAFIEAFWSSIATLPKEVKYGVGTLCWLLTAAYFGLGGRRGEA